MQSQVLASIRGLLCAPAKAQMCNSLRESQVNLQKCPLAGAATFLSICKDQRRDNNHLKSALSWQHRGRPLCPWRALCLQEGPTGYGSHVACYRTAFKPAVRLCAIQLLHAASGALLGRAHGWEQSSPEAVHTPAGGHCAAQRPG